MARPRKTTSTLPAEDVAVSTEDVAEKKSVTPQLQPAKFAVEGRRTICTVCGTEARLDLDRKLYCPNAHNHPPLEATE